MLPSSPRSNTGREGAGVGTAKERNGKGVHRRGVFESQ